MTRHAEMERPDEVQEAEFAREWWVRFVHPCHVEPIMHTSHRRPYSRLRERNIFDPTYRPRHMSHRAEGAAS